MPTLSFHFIHAADLHLGAAFGSIHQAAPEVAAELREATYGAFANILNYAIENKVDFVVLAGDIYNKNENSLQPQLRFRDGLQRLHAAGIPCCVIHGNHDPHDGTTAALAWPDSCHRFPATAAEPCVITKNGEAIAVVAGISYGKAAVLENLALRYTHARPDLYAVGVLHTNCGSNDNHARYSPSTIEELKGQNFDYWALGHIHTHAVLHAVAPAVVYSGSPQGLNPKEVGPHGFCHVHVDSSHATRIQFVPAAPVLWENHTLDAAAWATEDDAIEALETFLAARAAHNSGHSILLRLTIAGRSAIHKWLSAPTTQEVVLERLRILRGNAPYVWVDRIRFDTRPELDLDKLALAEDVLGEVLRQAHSASTEVDHSSTREQLEELFEDKRFGKILEMPEGVDLTNLLDRARLLVADRLADTGASS